MNVHSIFHQPLIVTEFNVLDRRGLSGNMLIKFFSKER